MFPGSNNPILPVASQQNDNNMNLAALHAYAQSGFVLSPYEILSDQFTQAQLHQLQQSAQPYQMHQMQASHSNLSHILSARPQFEVCHSLPSESSSLENVENPIHYSPSRIETPLPVQKSLQSNLKGYEQYPNSDSRRRPSLLSNFASSSLAPSEVGSSSFAESYMKVPDSMLFTLRTDSVESKKKSLTNQLEIVEKEMKNLEAERISLLCEKDSVIKDLTKARKSRYDEEGKENQESPEVYLDPITRLIAKIYSENRKIIQSHGTDFVHSDVDSNEFREFDDYEFVRETKARCEATMPNVINVVKISKRFEVDRMQALSSEYANRYNEWLESDELMCKSATWIEKKEKNREIYERTFPELKKAREEKERNPSNQNEENEEEERRQLSAVIPPIPLSHNQFKKITYVDFGILVEDAMKKQRNEHDEFISSWSEEEKKVFTNQLMVYGKNFAAIAVFLDRKIVKDCVHYYYLTKDQFNYKQYLKRRKKTFKNYRVPIMPNRDEIKLSISHAFPKHCQETDSVEPALQNNECFLCKRKIDNSSSLGRLFTRASFEAYGIDPNQAKSTDMRICGRCQVKKTKTKTSVRCEFGTCSNAKRKIRSIRTMPIKWKSATPLQRAFLMDTFSIPEGTTKCCTACYNKISKKLDLLLVGSLATEIEQWEQRSQAFWSTNDNELLLNAVRCFGTHDWDTVAIAFRGEKKFTGMQCEKQYKEMSGKNTSSEAVEEKYGDDGDDCVAGKVSKGTLEEKNEAVEFSADHSSESSGTPSGDEGANHDDPDHICARTSKTSPVYKPRFQGSLGVLSGADQVRRIDDTHCSDVEKSYNHESKSEYLSYHCETETEQQASTVRGVFELKSDPTNFISPEPSSVTVSNAPEVPFSPASTRTEIKKRSSILLESNANTSRTSPNHFELASMRSDTTSVCHTARGSITKGTSGFRSNSESKSELSTLASSTPPCTTSPLVYSSYFPIHASPIPLCHEYPVSSSSLQQSLISHGSSATSEATETEMNSSLHRGMFKGQYSQAAFLKYLQQVQLQQKNEIDLLRLNLHNKGIPTNIMDFYPGVFNNPEYQALMQQQMPITNEQKLIQLQHLLLQQQNSVPQQLINPIFPGFQPPIRPLLLNDRNYQHYGLLPIANIIPVDLRPAARANSYQFLSDLCCAEQMQRERGESARKLDLQEKHLSTGKSVLQKVGTCRDQCKIYPESMSSECRLDDRLYLQRSPSGALRSLGDDRVGISGLVSKGAMKEFPPSVSKALLNIHAFREPTTPHTPYSSHSVIGVNRTQADFSQPSKSTGEPIFLPTSVRVSPSLSCSMTIPDTSSTMQPCIPYAVDIPRQELQVDNPHARCDIVDRGYPVSVTGTGSFLPELKRKSGIHTVCIPSISHPHHSLNTRSSLERRALSPSGNINKYQATLSSLSSSTAHQPESQSAVVRSACAAVPQRNPIYIAPGPISLPYPTHASSHSSFRPVTPASPYQHISLTLGEISPRYSHLVRVISPNARHQFQHSHRLQTIDPSAGVQADVQSHDPSLDVTVGVSTSMFKEQINRRGVEKKVKTGLTTNNFEPLSPDSSDSEPPASVPPITESSNQMSQPLFSLINLPFDEGPVGTDISINRSPGLTENRSDSNSSSRQPSVVPPIRATSNPLRQPTYEPLSDDD